MKVKLTTLSLFLALCAISQKTDKTSIKYEYEMYPLETISKDKVVDINVSFDYAAKVDAANADLAAKQEQAKKDKEEYDKKSVGKKLLENKVMGESKPTGVFNNTEFIPTVFPASDLEAMINIPGFTKTEGAKCVVNASFSEFKYTFNANKTVITYYPLRVELTVNNDKGVSVYQGDVPNNNAAVTYSAKANDFGSNYITTMKSLELNAKNAAIANLNKYLKTNYGFNLVKDNAPFFDVKDKKFEYPDYHQAIQKLETAFISVNIPERQEKFNSSLRECIAIWETNMKELDKSNKSAKISADVAAATTLNLALAYTWLKDFDKAYDYLAEHKALDKDYSNAYDDISKFLKDYNTRYNKYSKY